MDENKLYTCCFFGHRSVKITEELKIKLRYCIEDLIIHRNVTDFLFGSRSKFDELCYEITSELKRKYTYINRIYVRAEYQHIKDDYRKYLLTYYEATYFPKNITNAGKAVYIERNYEMINKSSYCICYYDENYLPQKRNKSGTKVAYDYAVRKGVKLINMFV